MFRAAGTNNYQQLTETSKTLKILTTLANENRSTDPILTGIYTIAQLTVVSLLFSFSSHKASQFSHDFRSASPVRRRPGVTSDRYQRIWFLHLKKGFHVT